MSTTSLATSGDVTYDLINAESNGKGAMNDYISTRFSF